MEFKRLQLSLLFMFNFFGILIYLFYLKIIPMELTRGTLLSGTATAFLTLVPVFTSLVFNKKLLTIIIGMLATFIVLLLGIVYLISGEIIIGSIICLLSYGGITGSVFSIKWLKQK